MQLFMWISLLAMGAVSVALAHEGHVHTHHHTQNLSSDLQLPITIYYEALCPDSIKFFQEQLDPTYKALGKYINVNFVPFGKAKQWYSNDSYQFECQHGPIECYGNIVQACAINEFHDPGDIFNYVTCLMTKVNPNDVTNATYPVDRCADGLDVDKVKDCVSGKVGLRFLSEMGNKTSNLQPPLQGVPAVAINNTFSLEQQKDAVTKLKFLVCSQLKVSSANPAECASSSVTAVSSILLVALASLFLTTTAS